MLTVLDRPVELQQWLLFSLALHTTAVWVGWKAHTARSGWLARQRLKLSGQKMAGLGLQIARFAYYILIPYLLLVQRGGISAVVVGLVGPGDARRTILGWEGPAWSAAVAQTLGWVAGIGILLLVCWWLFARLARRTAGTVGVIPGLVPPPSPGVMLRETALLEAHWAFYRTAAILWTGPGGGPVWGVFTGLALVGLEAALDPFVWYASRYPLRSASIVLTGGLAWLSAGLYLSTHNLWLIALAHVALLAISSVALTLLVGRSLSRTATPRMAEERT